MILCQAYESRAPPEWSRKGDGIVIKSQTILSDKACEELKRNAKEIAVLNVWDNQEMLTKKVNRICLETQTYNMSHIRTSLEQSKGYGA